MGKSNTNKSSILRGRKLFILLGTVFVLFFLLYVFRGWGRRYAIPRVVTVLYGNSAEKIYISEMKKLENPISLLGYKSTESQIKGCPTNLAKGISTQVYCIYDVRAYGTIAKSSLTTTELNANAEKLQNLLKQNGWQGEYNDVGEYTSLKKLISNVSSGIDYQPDATYEKQIGNVTCYFHSNTAFSAPNPPALATQISCTRIFNILGTPSWE